METYKRIKTLLKSSKGDLRRKKTIKSYRDTPYESNSIERTIIEIKSSTYYRDMTNLIKKSLNEGKLCAKGKSAAKRKYDVYPSAYANMYASAVCSGKVKSKGKKK